MKWKNMWAGALAAGFALMVGVVCYAQTDSSGMGNRPFLKAMKDRIAKAQELQARLNLTAEQKKLMKEAVSPLRGEMRSAMKQVVEKRRALVDVTAAQASSEETIRQAGQELGRAISDAAVVGNKIFNAVRPILTPEQVKLLREFKEEHRAEVDKFLQTQAD